MAKERKRPPSDIIPDSEDERAFSRAVFKGTEVIEISSDDEYPSSTGLISPSGTHAFRTSVSLLNIASPKRYNSRKRTPRPVLYEEVIELSDSSVEPSQPERMVHSSSQAHTCESSDDEGAILVLDDPRSGRNPIFRGTPSKSPNLATAESSQKKRQPVCDSKKKVKHADEQARRREYAEKLFKDLNNEVFGNGLPQVTKLVWNKRLLTTAGRAKWHRSKDGSQTTEIELAEKILDCDERIRNTLSHEMCHLACWIIDGNLKESHGKLWKNWASRVMKHRLDIKISTRHSYEISYPFRWECKKCSKIYGRFSKSIRPEEVVCGVCKEGRLVPLFETRKQAPATPRTSRMAAVKQQGSSCIPQTHDQNADIDFLSSIMDKIHVDNI